MTVDRFGRFVRLGWQPHELIWLEAAMSLKGYERMNAYYDLTQMTGRTYKAILARADKMRLQKLQDEAAAAWATKTVLVPARKCLPHHAWKPPA